MFLRSSLVVIVHLTAYYQNCILFCQNNVPLSLSDTFCLSIHLWMDALVVFTFWLWWIHHEHYHILTLGIKLIIQSVPFMSGIFPLLVFFVSQPCCHSGSDSTSITPEFSSQFSRGGAAKSYGNSVLNFLRNYQLFHSGLPISHSTPVLPCSPASVTLIIAPLVGVKWYFIVGLTCISLMHRHLFIYSLSIIIQACVHLIVTVILYVICKINSHQMHGLQIVFLPCVFLFAFSVVSLNEQGFDSN